jgi:hypothetical protein
MSLINRKGKVVIDQLGKSSFGFIVIGLDSENWTNPRQQNIFETAMRSTRSHLTPGRTRGQDLLTGPFEMANMPFETANMPFETAQQGLFPLSFVVGFGSAQWRPFLYLKFLYVVFLPIYVMRRSSMRR